MKKFLFAAGGLMLLTACGGGNDRAAIIDSCMAEGGSDKKTCECMADAAEENLNDKLYGKLADAARKGDENAANALMDDLSPEDQGQFMAFAMQAAMTCGAAE